MQLLTHLTPLQIRFVEEFVSNPLNATDALRRAGSQSKNPDVDAAQLLTQAKIQEAIGVRRAQVAGFLGVSPTTVAHEFAAVGFADMRDYAEWGPWGVRLLESKVLTEKHRAVASVSASDTKYGTNVTIKLHDKVAALTQLGRHFGMFTDKIEDVTKLSREERRDRLSSLLDLSAERAAA